jgi:hypothetical protein
MKRVKLIKTIEELGCDLIRHGAKHDWYRNPRSGVAQTFRAIGRSSSTWLGTSSGCSRTKMPARLIRPR